MGEREEGCNQERHQAGVRLGWTKGADSPAPNSGTQRLTLRAATVPVAICGRYPVLGSRISFHRVLGGTECHLHLTVVETETQRSWGSLAPAPNDQ